MKRALLLLSVYAVVSVPLPLTQFLACDVCSRRSVHLPNLMESRFLAAAAVAPWIAKVVEWPSLRTCREQKPKNYAAHYIG